MDKDNIHTTPKKTITGKMVRPLRKLAFLSKSASKTIVKSSKTPKPAKSARKMTPLRRSLSYDTLPRMKHKNVICQPVAFQRRMNASRFNDYNNQHLVLVCLSFISFTSMLAMSIIAPFFPIEAAKKGMRGSVNGMVFSSYALVFMIFSPVMSLVIPQIGTKLTLLLGILICGTSNILFGLLDQVDDSYGMFTILCFLVRGFEALGATAFSTSTYVILMEEFTSNVSTVFSIVETAVGLGLSLGPAIGGFLYSIGGYGLPFFVLGGFMLLNIPLCLFIIRDSNQCEIVKSPMQSYFKIIKIPKIFINGMVVIVVAMLISFLDPTLEPHMRTIGLTPNYVSLIFLIMSATYTISSPIIGWFANGIPNKFQIMTLGLLLLSAEFLFLGPAEFLGFDTSFTQTSITMAFVGISYSIAFIPTFETLLALALKHGFPDDVSTYSLVSGIWSSFCSFGEILGPVFGGFLVETIGFKKASTIMGFAALSMAILCGITCIYFDEYKPHSREEERPLKMKIQPRKHSYKAVAHGHHKIKQTRYDTRSDA